MSSQITRLPTGGVIQIRTGVVQGIGPQGPTGPTGPRGETGPQGAQGVPGPAGYAAQYSTLATSGATGVGATTVTSNYPTAWTNLSFGTISHDDINAVSSATNIVFPAGRDYNIQLMVRFYKPAGNGTGFRGIQVTYGGSTIQEQIIQAVSLTDTIMVLNASLRSTSGSTVMNLKVAHNEAATINVSSRLWINAVGPGAPGPAGPAGPPGPQGAQGVQGPAGPSGTIIDNTTTIAAIGGTNPA